MGDRSFSLSALVWVLGCLLGVPTYSLAASHFVLLNLDGPNEGLNDATPVSARGGNLATTRGEARLGAIEFAASLWAERLTSEVTIVVGVSFDELGGEALSAPLGLGGSEALFRDFPNAPRSGVWYPSALADKLAEVDLDPGAVDIVVTFNSDIDGNTALGTSRFYYGLDGNPPEGDVDLVKVAIHELAHGLGFSTFFDFQTGSKLVGRDDVYMLHLERHGATPADFPSMTDSERAAATIAGADVHWTGPVLVANATNLDSGKGPEGHIEIYSPSEPDSLSSLVHFAVSLSPDQVLEPFYSDSPLDLGLAHLLLADLGWDPPSACIGRSLP